VLLRESEVLAPPERTAANYRMYDESAVDRLQFIRGAQRLGLRLRRSRRRWRTMPGGARPSRPEQMLRNHIAEIDRELPAAVAAR
jgi:DNA-binding transcriptional MerR regulator